MKPGQTRIIACAAVLEEVRPFLPPDLECLAVQSGLHLRPEKLKEELQKLIHDVSGRARHIIVGFGLCSMAVVGLKSERSFLVVPRVDDCIAMYLGSQEAYKQQLRKEPGTYFLSRGWIEAGISLVDEFRDMEKRYGKDRTEKVKKAMLKHYTRLAFIHTGCPNLDQYREHSRRAAGELNLRYEEIEGTTRLLHKLVNGPWDESFIIVPPGQSITLEHFTLDRATENQPPPARSPGIPE